MRITRLRLTDFKAHHELEIAPAAGLTIVRGPNEAGKSTIRQALELALFRKADSRAEDIRQAWAWGATEAPTVELDFEVDGAAGTLRKHFAASHSEAELMLDGRSATDYTLIGDEITGLIGVPSESFFRATASVGHLELAAVAGDEPAIGDRLQKAVSGATQGTARAKKKLETAVRRYRSEGHKNPGLLKVGREGIGQLERELAQGETALQRLEADRAAWVEASERQTELEVRLERLQADLAEARRAEALAEQRAAAQASYDRLRRAAELREQAQARRRALPQATSLDQLRDATERAQELEYQISELQAEIDTAAEASAAEAPEGVPPRPMRWLAAAALLVLLGWAAMFALRDAGIVAFAVVALIAAGVTITLVQAFRLARRRRRYGLVLGLAEAAVSERQASLREQEDESRRRRRELDSLFGSLGVADLDAARALLASVDEQGRALAEIEGELRGLGVDEPDVRRLADARDQAAAEAAQAAHALAAMGSLAEDPTASRAALEREVSQTAPLRDAARSEADRAQGRVGANLVDADIVAGLAERLAAAREDHAELERRVLVYEGTLAAIEAAEQATLKTAARYLEEHMGPTVSVITDGRYEEVEVNERTLDFRVRAPETGELVDVGELSQGTADQLYLAARLGLVRLVTLDRRPPIVLDDPFVTFDATRGERALRLVREFAREHGFQVLFLTCSERFDALADELIVLPGPAAGRRPAGPPPDTPALEREIGSRTAPADAAGAGDPPEQLPGSGLDAPVSPGPRTSRRRADAGAVPVGSLWTDGPDRAAPHGRPDESADGGRGDTDGAAG